jgi:hypothetical protein
MSWNNVVVGTASRSSVFQQPTYSELFNVKVWYSLNCQVSPRYSLPSKTILRNISGSLINKSGFKLYADGVDFDPALQQVSWNNVVVGTASRSSVL